jgi:ribosomal protein S18 acetylase RimI-like enzyme
MCDILPGSPDDADEVAGLLTATDEHLFGYLTSGRLDVWNELAACEWRAADGVYGYPRGQVVRLGGRVVAVLVAYTGAEHLAAIDWSFAAARARLRAEVWAGIAARRTEIGFLFPVIPDEVFYIQNIAVADSARGTGLGRRVMEHAFALGRRAGCQACHLDVDSSTPAVRFYERLGMRTLVRTEVLSLPRIAPHLRMVIAL